MIAKTLPFTSTNVQGIPLKRFQVPFHSQFCEICLNVGHKISVASFKHELNEESAQTARVEGALGDRLETVFITPKLGA